MCVMLTACAHMGKKSQPADTVDSPSLGIGVRVVRVPEGVQDKGLAYGLEIVSIRAGSSAQEAGLRIDDIIIGYDSNTTSGKSKRELSKSFQDHVTSKKQVGEKLHLTLLRVTTDMSGEKNGKMIGIADREALDYLLFNQSPGERLVISIDKQIVPVIVDAVLQPFPYFQQKNPLKNHQLFPEYEELADAFTQLTDSLIAEFEITDQYDDILHGYAEDELWDDGFRLDLFRYLHRDPIKLPLIADGITTALEEHANAVNLPGLIQATALLLDEGVEASQIQTLYPGSRDTAAHFQFVKTTINSARHHRNLAFSKLTASERQFLTRHLEGFVAGLIASSVGPEKDDEPEMQNNLRIMRLAHHVDYTELLKSAMLLGALGDKEWLSGFETSLADFHPEASIAVKGVQGEVLYFEDTPFGQMVVGGRGVNRYDLDAAVIIDLGGSDFYANAAAAGTPHSPVSLVIDFNGDDQYGATAPVSQGAGFLGTGILIDVRGDDIYAATALSQGAGLMGIGILADYGGNDQYFGQELTQGIGFWGLGLLLDVSGGDRYHSHLFAQGVGGPKGAGLLMDVKGGDAYNAFGKYQSTYGSRGIFSGFSQGFGFGFRGYTSGGIGALIDSSGQDRFQAGNFSQGGGYFFGLGILKNSDDDDDVYVGSRSGQGFSAHSALGILIDDGGNDHYSGQVGALQGAAWDKGAAALIDKSGDDLYRADLQFFSQAAAAHNGFAIFIDQSGTDEYFFQNENKIGGNHYHGGSSFSFFIDNGGEPDRYNGRLEKNNTATLSGEYGIMSDLDHDIRP